MVVETKYYELLGISTTAGSDEVKKAYRKLSLRWHPDKNPTNREEAEEKFKLLAEAYSVLSDAEMRSKYDQYGEAGLKRNFQPGQQHQQQQSYQQHNYNSHGGSGGGGDFGFRFRPAHDIFREFFGGQDPFASMFSMNTFADPFADPFFSQQAGPSGLRANTGGGGGSVAVGGFGGFGFGGFPSMMFASPFGNGSAMPATGSFSFVSSSTIGGAGGLRGPSGPSTRTSIQVVNGVKMQTIEEDDGHGNVTITRIDPSGHKDITVNGVPQQTRTSPRKNIDEGNFRQQQQQQQQQQSYAQASQRRNSADHYSHAPTSPPKSARADTFNGNSAAKEAAYSGSDSDSVVEVDIVEVDSSSSSSDENIGTRPTGHPKGTVHPQATAGTAAPAAAASAAAPKKPIVHDMPSPPTTEPNTKRHEAEARFGQQKQQQQQQRDRASSHSESVPLSAPVNKPLGPRVSAHAPHQQYTPQPQPQPQQRPYTQHQPQYQPQQRYDYREPAGDINASTRTAPRNEGEDILAAARNKLRSTGNGSGIAAMDERRPHMGVKDALKATGASILKARPRMNRSSSAPKVPLEQPGQHVPDNRAYAPIHRPPPPPNAAEPPRNAYVPPPPAAQHYVSVQSTLTGRGAPGHKQPRSRDRMRSTLHYENFTAPSVHHASYATLSSQPPMPQQPVDTRAPTPGYAYLQHRPTTQPSTHYQGQAMYVDPSAGPAYVSPQSAAGPVIGSRRQYDDQPLSATQAKNKQQQQQPMTTGATGTNTYAANQHASVHTGASHGSSAAGHY